VLLDQTANHLYSDTICFSTIEETYDLLQIRVIFPRNPAMSCNVKICNRK